MVGWHHQFYGHEFEQTLGDSEGQGSLACCSPVQGRKESDKTEKLNNDNNTTYKKNSAIKEEYPAGSQRETFHS